MTRSSSITPAPRLKHHHDHDELPQSKPEAASRSAERLSGRRRGCEAAEMPPKKMKAKSSPSPTMKANAHVQIGDGRGILPLDDFEDGPDGEAAAPEGEDAA